MNRPVRRTTDHQRQQKVGLVRHEKVWRCTICGRHREQQSDARSTKGLQEEQNESQSSGKDEKYGERWTPTKQPIQIYQMWEGWLRTMQTQHEHRLQNERMRVSDAMPEMPEEISRTNIKIDIWTRKRTLLRSFEREGRLCSVRTLQTVSWWRTMRNRSFHSQKVFRRTNNTTNHRGCPHQRTHQ